jgi:hypothetical protein
MNVPPVDELIDRLAADAKPVRPLASPLKRALKTLALLALGGGIAVLARGDAERLLARYAGREGIMALELAAMLATGVLAVTAAFFVSFPGRSRRWLLAPIPPFLLWLFLSGLGCYGDWVRNGPTGLELGHSLDCLLFILATSIFLAPLLIWRLSRAAPIDPLPVALLGGLGIAALAAFLLNFFHETDVTVIDLAVHLVAILLVVAATGLLNRRTLAPA